MNLQYGFSIPNAQFVFCPMTLNPTVLLSWEWQKQHTMEEKPYELLLWPCTVTSCLDAQTVTCKAAAYSSAGSTAGIWEGRRTANATTASPTHTKLSLPILEKSDSTQMTLTAAWASCTGWQLGKQQNLRKGKDGVLAVRQSTVLFLMPHCHFGSAVAPTRFWPGACSMAPSRFRDEIHLD